MKHFFISFVVVTLASACIPSTQISFSESAPTTTASLIPATATKTELPPTATPTPIPTLALPVGQLTPVPSASEKIGAVNVKNLQEVARYYGDINYAAKLTKDAKFLFILDPGGLTKYNYESMEPVTSIPLANSASDLQISNDGTWAIVDNNWLLDLSSEKEPQIQVLPDLLDFHPHIFALSPDGSLIAAQRYSCPNLCSHELRIISTKDFSVVHTSSGQTLQNVIAFSPDGTYLATVDRFTQANPDGSTSATGGFITIWKTSDFSKVSNIEIRFPFRASSIAFSADNATLALAQIDFIDIYDVESGSSVSTIGLCQAFQRKVMFVRSSPPPFVAEHSECSSGTWMIFGNSIKPEGDSVPDFSKIIFDDKGNVETIPYTHSIVSEFRPYRQEYYFRFLNDDTLSFKTFDSQTLDRYSCDLSLTNSSFDCQTHTPEFENGVETGKSRILATDGKYYDYTVSASTIEIYSPENPGRVYASIPFQNYGFDLLALDPVNNVAFYNMALSPSLNRAVIQDLESNQTVQKWEGDTFISSLALSANGKYAALCHSIGYSNRSNKDKLIIFDLTEKKIIYNEAFTCSGVSLAFNHDGSKLALEHFYLRNPTDSRYSLRLLTMNPLPPYDKQYVDLEGLSRAVSFSPDDSLLAAACNESDICFFDGVTNTQIFQLKAHSQITNIAFSPEGNYLAASSDWGLISVWAVSAFKTQ
jgi:WD40 repeat protein